MIAASLLVLLLISRALLSKPTLPVMPQAVTASKTGQKEAVTVQVEPQELLAQATQALQSRRSVSARLLVGVNLYGEGMEGSGLYREEQPARSRRLRLEVNLQRGDEVTRLLKVCDGRHFWDYRQIASEQTPQMACYDLQRIERAFQKAGIAPPQQGTPWAFTAGLVKLLRTLDEMFLFDSVQADKLDQISVWRIAGGWRPEWLARLLPDQKKRLDEHRPIDVSKFAPYQPDRVVLYLGQDDLFPYRMECCRTLPGQPRSGVGSVVLVYLQLAEVEFNLPLNPAYFNYNPGDVKFPDATDAFLRQRDLRD